MDKKKFVEKIYLRAIKDSAFRKELKKNPRKVIERELGEKLPETITWEIMEENKNKRYIVLPDFTETKDLSDAELKNIAAGLVQTKRKHCYL
jgi:hypothetical protein